MNMFWLCLAVVLSAQLALADFRNLASVQDGCGGMSTNTVVLAGTAYTNVSAAGQPGGVCTSTNGGWINYAGFLQAVDIKRPGLDSDGDGVIDELSLDNDSDSLTDVAEIGGTAFNPWTITDVNRADSDGDGMRDGQEADAGSNPTNRNSMLAIVSIATVSSNNLITWHARADGVKKYVVMASDRPSYANPTRALATNTYSAGAAPWYEADVSYTDCGATSNRYYFIRAIP